MIFPNPDYKEEPKKEVVVLKEGYCSNGHTLINSRIQFDKFPGIHLRVKGQDGQRGFVGISPVYGAHSRISIDVDLKSGDIMELSCPTCETPLPVFSKCSCGADLVAIFFTKHKNLNDCVVVCSRVDCFNASVKNGGEHLAQDYFESARETR